MYSQHFKNVWGAYFHYTFSTLSGHSKIQSLHLLFSSWKLLNFHVKIAYLVFLRIFTKFLYFEKRHKFQPLISRSKPTIYSVSRRTSISQSTDAFQFSFCECKGKTIKEKSTCRNKGGVTLRQIECRAEMKLREVGASLPSPYDKTNKIAIYRFQDCLPRRQLIYLFEAL